MYLSAKVDYALRAMCALADAEGRPMTADSLAKAQQLPVKFLESILNDLRRAGLLSSQRGADGGYRFARPAETIALADVMRIIDGPLAEIRGLRVELTEYEGAAEDLKLVWIAVRSALRSVLEQTTVADVAAHRLPAHVLAMTEEPDAWIPRLRV